MKKGAASLSDRFALGRRLRDRVRRASHGAWEPPHGRLDVVADFRLSNAGRLTSVLPHKVELMAHSPFAYFRGSARRMTADLAAGPIVGALVQVCGDAHVQNVGAYAGADGHLTFDLNDFDETDRGPWEWDVKRFATSLVVAGRDAHNGDARCADAVRSLSRSYRAHMQTLAHTPFMEVMRYKVRRTENAVARTVLARAERADPLRQLKRLTTVDARGRPRFHDRPPALRPVLRETARAVIGGLEAYRLSLPSERQRVLEVYRPVDVAFRIGGLGALGLENYVVLLLGPAEPDPLVLQLKQAVSSAVHSCRTSRSPRGHQGRRIAEGQTRMQTGTDPLVGWTTVGGKPFVVRQLADHKAKIRREDLRGRPLDLLGELAGEILAKAHARTGDAAVIAGYCGRSDRLDEALASFALAYADQTEADHAAFQKARKRGDL